MDKLSTGSLFEIDLAPGPNQFYGCIYSWRIGFMVAKNRGPGRPAIGKGTPVMVRLHPDMLGALDGFIANDPRRLTRPQAIIALMKMMIGAPAANRERRAQELLARSRQRHGMPS